ncbi:MAG: hypothetical protein QM626_13530 [Microbacterium sp.]|uniref:hypothetical protein n=1 Tax=Microbacterium sp. TaxID=51671 RepID=UPI0039E3B93C
MDTLASATAARRVGELRVPELDLAVHFVLHDDVNAETADAVWNALPFETVIGHQVIAGGGLWVITRLTYLGSRAAVRRTPGSVYFYPLIHSLNLTYDDVRETAFVNEFARVPDDELPILARIGRHVWTRTVLTQATQPVRVVVRRAVEAA